jgi:DNA-binding NarL/FixJ family response regulator
MMKAKVFIVDDHYMVVEGIRSLLSEDPSIEWMGHASNADSCLAFLQKQQPDVILMDINMPGKSGIELCQEVKAKYPGVFVIGLSTFNQQSFIQKMMDHGASGYVLKNATQKELLEATNTVIKGRTYFSEEAADVMRKTDESSAPLITRREKEVLELLAEGLTNQEIASRLFVSTTTIDSHRKSLLAKLHAKNTAELIKLAFQHKIIAI